MEFDVTYIISMALAILAGFSLTTGSEISKGTFTWRKFGVRLMYTFGLVVIVSIYWINEGKDKRDLLLIMAGIALFGDTIVPLIFKVGNKLIQKYAKNIEND